MKFEGKIVFTITDQSKIDPYSDFELWETLTVTFERLKRPPLGAAHAVGQMYEVPPPPGRGPDNQSIHNLYLTLQPLRYVHYCTHLIINCA